MELGRPFATAAVLAAVSSVHAQDAVQWRVEDGGNGHWYAVAVVPGASWNDAKIMALSRGGYLGTLTSAPENEFVFGLVDADPYWIVNSYGDLSGPFIGGFRPVGGPDPELGWSWVSGERWDFAAWAPAQPNNANGNQDAVQFWTAGSVRVGNWNDIPSSETTEQPGTLVIEWSADCNNDSIVDFGQILDGTYADEDANGVPDCCEGACPGDLNGDDSVGPPDLGILLAVWGTDGGKISGADINEDGTVNAADLGLLVGAWGDCGCN